jgi:glycosyltransferase involved in cell wall biosynthesis
MKKKKILIVTYYFYPCDLIGAKRTSCLANFLDDKEIDITILKADNENYYNRIDDNLYVNSGIRINNVNNIIKLKSFKESIFWYFSYKKEIQRLIIKEDYDLLYFNGDPFFYFSLGNYFFKKYKIDYILDFRDIWVNGFKTKSNWKGNIVQFFKRYFEKKAIKTAKMVIQCTESRTKIYQDHYKKFNKVKFMTVFNGFDESKLPELEESHVEKKNNFKLGIFGKFYYYNPEHALILLNAIKKLKQTTKITIFHIGKKENELVDLVKQNELEENFEFLGYKNYSEGLKILNTMDFLILNNRADYELGTKIYDYFFLNKPILSFITPNSEIWKLLSKFSNTFLIQTPEDFISAINYLKKAKDYSVINNSEIKKFSRKYQMEYLYSILKSLN